ncbi:hypothetical protein HID58_008523, partial [Brassica napus]
MHMTNIQRTRVHVVVIFLLIQIVLFQVETIASNVHPNIFTRKSMVRITNRLGDGSTLNLHCKSPDDDLGLKILATNNSWSFTFRPNIWGNTTQVLVVMIISLLIQISLLQAETIASDVHPNISTLKSMVRITNRLGDGSTLNLH